MKKDYSFGIIPFCKKEEEALFLIVKHFAGHWGFPKGHREGNETDIETAKREFCEETGICEFQIISEKPFVTETYKTHHPVLKDMEKTVCYYLAEVFNEKVCLPEEEIVDAKWCGVSIAEETLTHERTREILRDAHKHLVDSGVIDL